MSFNVNKKGEATTLIELSVWGGHARHGMPLRGVGMSLPKERGADLIPDTEKLWKDFRSSNATQSMFCFFF